MREVKEIQLSTGSLHLTTDTKQNDVEINNRVLGTCAHIKLMIGNADIVTPQLTGDEVLFEYEGMKFAISTSIEMWDVALNVRCEYVEEPEQ